MIHLSINIKEVVTPLYFKLNYIIFLKLYLILNYSFLDVPSIPLGFKSEPLRKKFLRGTENFPEQIIHLSIINLLK